MRVFDRLKKPIRFRVGDREITLQWPWRSRRISPTEWRPAPRLWHVPLVPRIGDFRYILVSARSHWEAVDQADKLLLALGYNGDAGESRCGCGCDGCEDCEGYQNEDVRIGLGKPLPIGPCPLKAVGAWMPAGVTGEEEAA